MNTQEGRAKQRPKGSERTTSFSVRLLDSEREIAFRIAEQRGVSACALFGEVVREGLAKLQSETPASAA